MGHSVVRPALNHKPPCLPEAVEGAIFFAKVGRMLRSMRAPAAPAAGAAVLAIALLAGCTSIKGGLGLYRHPNRRLEPQEVVQIQATALSDRENPVAGLELAYRFQSPDGPARIESFEEYRAVFDRPVFKPLRTAFDIRYHPVIRMQRIAIQRITVSSTKDVDAVYDFRLRRSPEGSCPGCWLVLSIRPVEITPRDSIDAI